LRLSNSDFTASRVMEANPDVGAVLTCVPGLPQTWQPETRSADPRWGRQSVIIVGRMIGSERYKGHDELLEAWPAVVAAIPDAHLVCVGEGDDVPRLRAKAASLGVGARVSFPGFVTAAIRQQAYGDAAVFAMPSRREGFGLVYLEAMASGLPCIASVHDAAREVVVDGVTGYLVSREDTAGLSARLVSLLDDEPKRRAMGEAGRRRVSEQFTFDAFRHRLEERLAGAWPVNRDRARSVVSAGRS
jgi:phosphatidylinositol alpha-1,6-mannosyltransferase